MGEKAKNEEKEKKSNQIIQLEEKEEIREEEIEEKVEEEKEIETKKEGIEKEEDDKKEQEKKGENEEKNTKGKWEVNIDSNGEEKKRMSKKKKIIVIGIGIILLLLILVFSTIFSLINVNNTNIIQGVFVDNVNMSGLSVEEAKSYFQTIIEEKKTQNILLHYEDFETAITLEQIGASVNIEEIVEEAYQIGRKGNIFQNNYEILAKKITPANLEFTITFNEENFQNTINNISYSLPGTVVQSSYYINGENLVITRGSNGIIVEQSQMLELLKTLVKDILQGKELYEITIPVTEVEPNPIDIEAIHNEIYKEPQDAYITQDPFQLFVQVNGVDFDVESAKSIIEQDQDEYIIPLIITVPEITVDKLGEEAFPNVLGSYSTNYGASGSNRGINIAIAAKTINNTILLPGEVFSYNQVVGDTTPDKGYKLGGSYLNGELVQSYGGGICQVSSTLYNAVLYANLEIVLRYNHSSTVGYVPASRDATVSYGGKDFQFKNSRNYPIKISATATNGVLKIAIYGIKEEEEYEVEIESKVTGSIPYTTKYVEDNTLAAGQQVVKSNGSNGLKSVAYKVLKQNGVVISRTLLSQDTYNPMQRVVRVGTKK